MPKRRTSSRRKTVGLGRRRLRGGDLCRNYRDFQNDFQRDANGKYIQNMCGSGRRRRMRGGLISPDPSRGNSSCCIS